MTWVSIGIGIASFVLLWRGCRRWRRPATGAAEVALRALGGAGLAMLSALAADASVVASAVAALAAVVLVIDVRRVTRGLTARLRRHASTVTPFQNAA